MIEESGKKVIGILDEGESRFAGSQGYDGLNLFPRAMFIVGALHYEFGFAAFRKVSEVRTVYGNPDADQFVYAGIRTANPQPDPTAKTETANEQRDIRKFRGEKIYGGLDLAAFAQSSIVFASTQARATKIEAQDGNAERVQRFRGLVDNLVVHRATE
jgi:hypothetical protein